MARSSVATYAFGGTGVLGGNWTQLYAGVGGSMMEGSGVSYASATAFVPEGAAACYAGGTFADNQYSEVRIAALADLFGDYNIGVIVRASTDTGSGRDFYYVYIESSTGGPTYNTVLGKVSDGSDTILNEESQAWAVNDLLSLEVDGGSGDTELRVCKDGTPLGGNWTKPDATSPLLTGYPGIVGGGGTTSVALDDWEGGDLTAAGPVITDVNTTESWDDGDTGLVITGSNFV